MATERLLARFRLDDEGRPRRVNAGDTDHFEIDLSIADARADTYAVTYLLHESYYNPVRESRRQNDHFVESITSYGDYDVKAKVRTRTGVDLVARRLSDALAEGHAGDQSTAIKEGLASIRAN